MASFQGWENQDTCMTYGYCHIFVAREVLTLAGQTFNTILKVAKAGGDPEDIMDKEMNELADKVKTAVLRSPEMLQFVDVAFDKVNWREISSMFLGEYARTAEKMVIEGKVPVKK